MDKKKVEVGHLHPVSQIIREIAVIFNDLGFEVADGPELEKEWYNFDALNIPGDHPARDMQDTFWIKQKTGKLADGEKTPDEKANRLVLRTQTSAVQIRYMEDKIKKGIKPPYRIIVPGKVFRNEATDATHEAQFFQVECLYVDKNVTLANLKWIIETFLKKLFGDDVKIRFRPSYFPFVEPALEVDMLFKGKWLEMGGSGLVHPHVLDSVGVDSKEYSGLAFGFGIDRLVMLKHEGIDDIRNSYNGDLRFVTQF
ncbi:MAG: phenylalanine--tRNA ligase subunit alpha [Candidatus Taylorbacteria bacterium]|nr:phenylalanine--tRNA ligase subunit alpha [Candidatus Taylorbacteria bacterium]